MSIMIAYVPVIHQGYMTFFEKFFGEVKILFILGRTFTHDKRPFQKDIRAIDPYLVKNILEQLGLFEYVFVLEREDDGFNYDLSGFSEVVMPYDSLSREVTDLLPRNISVSYIDYFLRWDSDNAKAHLDVNCPTIDPDEFLEQKLKQVIAEGHKTSDIYREVGGMIFNRESDEYLIGYNSAFPDENLPYYEGDPRSLFKKGIHVDLSTVLHAEARLISEAARIGFCTEGSEIIVTDFPCPPCSKLIANSGIKTVYFLKGYTMLDGERVLKDSGVSIFKINTPQS